jgi:hypothetical protein
MAEQFESITAHLQKSREQRQGNWQVSDDDFAS